MKKYLPLYLLTHFLLTASLVHAMAPVHYYNSLVAGSDPFGYQDGAFSLARFNNPSGLALDDSGHDLFVADSGNNRIRVVHLDQNNIVNTVAGNDPGGSTDGPISIATFSYPKKIASLSEGRLAVFDAGSAGLRLVDLKSRSVTTILKGNNISDMVFRKNDGCLYFSEPAIGKIEKIDLRSLNVSTVLSLAPAPFSPGPLCLNQNDLYVADNNSSAVFELGLENNTTPVTLSSSLKPAGTAADILALTFSDGILYGFQKGGSLLRIGSPQSESLDLPTPWGLLYKNQDHGGYTSLFDPSVDDRAGFLASSNEPRKFFISSGNSIVSVADYDFKKYWPAIEENVRALTDFTYPYKKPDRTFRILVIGSSRNSTAVPIPADPSMAVNEDSRPEDLKVFTYSKQLEFMLNTEASLKDSSVHFEVLNLTRRGMALTSYAYDQVPGLVKKYDIDLVLGLADILGYREYYERPLTSEGIPQTKLDPEFLLRPLSARTPPGVASDIVARCKTLKIAVSNDQKFPGDGSLSLYCQGDPQLQNDFVEIEGQRLNLLNEALKRMRTSGTSSPKLVLFYAPSKLFPTDCSVAFWTRLCARYQIGFLDLSEAYNVLKYSYGPTGTNHHTAYGNELIALLLKHFLIENKLIPF